MPQESPLELEIPLLPRTLPLMSAESVAKVAGRVGGTASGSPEVVACCWRGEEGEGEGGLLGGEENGPEKEETE